MAFLDKYPDGLELVTVYEACTIADVSRRTIYNWMHKNKIDYVRTAGGSIRIVKDTLFSSEREAMDEPTNATIRQSDI